jgi:hypothetical protein
MNKRDLQLMRRIVDLESRYMAIDADKNIHPRKTKPPQQKQKRHQWYCSQFKCATR